MLLTDLTEPCIPFSTETLASFCKSINFGAAETARIPKITITAISSIRVKPADLFPENATVLDVLIKCNPTFGFLTPWLYLKVIKTKSNTLI